MSTSAEAAHRYITNHDVDECSTLEHCELLVRDADFSTLKTSWPHGCRAR
jgi:hypothetical protein